jgi:multicomponent Na+:H+ antiporter subunit E
VVTVRKWPVVGVGLAVAWLFVRGVALEPVRLLVEGTSGLLVGLPVAFLLRRLYNPTTDVGRRVRSAPFVALYVLTFLRELLTANVDVARRVLAPSLPIAPAVIRFPLRVRSDAAITAIANSITLTPGTLTLDYDPNDGSLLVHAIAVDDPEAVVAPVRRWENYALRLFDEPLTPNDPPPAPATIVDPEAFDATAVPLAEAAGAYDAPDDRGGDGG